MISESHFPNATSEVHVAGTLSISAVQTEQTMHKLTAEFHTMAVSDSEPVHTSVDPDNFLLARVNFLLLKQATKTFK